MKTIQFRTATVTLLDHATVSTFVDGHVNTMWLTDPSIHASFAIEAGYGHDWKRYMREHDLIHHIIADAFHQPWSWAIHDGDPSVPVDQATQQIRDEEHLVQRLQRLIMLGQPDPFGQLQVAFGTYLPDFARGLAARLDAELGPIPRNGL